VSHSRSGRRYHTVPSWSRGRRERAQGAGAGASRAALWRALGEARRRRHGAGKRNDEPTDGDDNDDFDDVY